MSFSDLTQLFRCDHCGVVITKHEPVYYDRGHHFCSREHLRLHLDLTEHEQKFQEELDFIAQRGSD